MRAVTVPRFGSPDVLEVVTDWPEPDPPGPDEVLVTVHAAGLNPSDCKIRGGMGPLPDDRSFPYVAGREAAGVVEAVGDEVTEFAPGDPVFAFFGWFSRFGGHAERVVVPAAAVARRPDSIPVVEAAAVPLAGLTAWQALGLLQAPPEATVVITGGAGGVGCFAVQLAAERGHRVVATASATSFPLVEDLGADVVVDYHDPHHIERLVDLAGGSVSYLLDLVGPGTIQGLVPVLAADARVVAVAGLAGDLPSSVAARAMRARPDGVDLSQLAERLEDGRLRALVDERFPLEEARSAHERLEGGRVHGKLVLTVT
ncbi:MAG: hypothetical protein QOJ19_1460 [Acidimicrobiia bacterium]|nr:hypothetical protein [Acidimicrobiia bacterium]